MNRRRLAVFGSTGSIGTSTLELARQFPEQFDVVALTAGRNLVLLRQQMAEFRPKVVVVTDPLEAATLAKEWPGVEVLHGPQGLVQCARWEGFDLACQAILGFAALAPTLELVRGGKVVALANKEALVVAGPLLMQAKALSAAQVIPVDSEHNALFQLLEGKPAEDIQGLVLTASGGPFWRKRDIDFTKVTPSMAVQHPNWRMGAKISVDSATMMNKGLEVVEAQRLFGVPIEQIEVWVHPQSIIHGAIWLKDGTCQAQLSKPDMKASISYALGFPGRLPGAVAKLPLREMAQLEFSEPDTARFPCLDLPRQAFLAGPSYLIALNAANEMAVDAFLSGQLRFSDIPAVLQEVLSHHEPTRADSVEAIGEIDHQAREYVTGRLTPNFKS